MTLPDDPPIEPVYPIENLIGLLAGGGAAYRIGAQILARYISRTKITSANPVFKRPKDIPEDWQVTYTKRRQGVVYTDPKNSGTYVKVQKANSNSSQPGQKYDNVRIQKNGQSYDLNGNKVPQKSEEAHIPLKNFRFPKELF